MTPRPLPGWWIRLPPEVGDAATLAAHLRQEAAAIGGDASREWPQVQLLAAAGLLERCAPLDAGCLRGVVAELDARAAAAPADGGWGERLYWESVAHAVERVAHAVASA